MKQILNTFDQPEMGPNIAVGTGVVMAAPDGGGGPPEGHGGGRPPDVGGGGGNGGGKPPNAGPKKGELYGDQIVVLRDLDPNDDDQDEDGSGAPVLDGNEQLIVVGYDPLHVLGGEDGLFPIYFTEVGEGDYEISPEFLPFVQEVELERANVARAPEHVMYKALLAALDSITDEDGSLSDDVTTDAAGRLMYSSNSEWFTIDAPLENLALYQALMTAGTGDPGYAWVDVKAAWGTLSVDGETYDLSGLNDLDGWDPSSLLAGAWGKEGEITLDALIYENTTLGVNPVTGSGETLDIHYFDFEDGATETYDHVRSERYGDIEIGWWEFGEDDQGNPTATWMEDTVLNAVFPNLDYDPDDAESLPYVEWGAEEDVYLALDATGDEFIYVDASDSGVNDFAHAADDSRAVISFIHDNFAVPLDGVGLVEGFEIA